MIAISAKEARQIDGKLRDEFGISTLVLMENAGAAVCREALKTGKKKIAVICGKGNNGGDGLVCCRHLLAAGIAPDLFLASPVDALKEEARANFDILLKLGQRAVRLDETGAGGLAAKKYSLIIDALLGVGFSGAVEGAYAGIIASINSSSARVISVDIPSGLDADNGTAMGCCVEADMTVTFIAPKRGMLAGAGPGYCGKIIVAGLGIPPYHLHRPGGGG